jgi:DNA mismatch repair ATPase MutS
MAELRRLKGVVDAALVAQERPVLYLLDEIMQGTNTAERQIASRAVLDQLTGANAIGAISSHDLGLLAASPLDQRSTKAHFAEQFQDGREGPEMTFDYRLRPGIATSTNALKLMELLGFDLETDPARTDQ